MTCCQLCAVDLRGRRCSGNIDPRSHLLPCVCPGCSSSKHKAGEWLSPQTCSLASTQLEVAGLWQLLFNFSADLTSCGRATQFTTRNPKQAQKQNLPCPGCAQPTRAPSGKTKTSGPDMAGSICATYPSFSMACTKQLDADSASTSHWSTNVCFDTSLRQLAHQKA